MFLQVIESGYGFQCFEQLLVGVDGADNELGVCFIDTLVIAEGFQYWAIPTRADRISFTVESGLPVYPRQRSVLSA